MNPHNIPQTRIPQQPFGLIAWLEQTRVVLPLKGVECRFHVNGAVASVELDQIYHQTNTIPLDCTYTFPLPAGAAVHRCEIHNNDRVIRARVEEREIARGLHRTHKAAGRRTALVETERENLFTLTLGNVQPGDLVVVRFAWFQVLDRAGDQLRLLVPTCPGVRYIPGKPLLRAQSGRGTIGDTDQVRDASRITPPRIDELHPDAAYFSIEGRLSAADVEIRTLSSPTHGVLIRQALASRVDTYPVQPEVGVSRLAVNTSGPSLDDMPAADGSRLSFTRLPLPHATEELMQMVGCKDPIRLHYIGERVDVSLSWDTAVLPDALIWISNGGRPHAPWSGRHFALGVEPMSGFFDLGRVVQPTPEHPLHAEKGVALEPGKSMVVNYCLAAAPG